MARLSLPLVLAGAVGVLSLGVAAGAAFVPSDAPSGVAATARPSSVEAAEVQTTDELDATLKVTASAARTVSTRTRGTVTASECAPGATLASGSAGIAVNDASLIHLASSQPLWRDVAIGDTGPDVRSLQSELARLGYGTTVDGRFGTGTLGAVKRLAEVAGAADARAWTGFPSSRFVWLPASTVTVASCDVRVGQEVAEQDPIATLPNGISAAVVTPLPTNAMPGPRVVVAGSLVIPVDDRGAITAAADLDRLAASDAYRAFTDEAGTREEGPVGPEVAAPKTGMSVQYRLAEPLTVFAVPAAAVYAAAGATGCVFERGKAREVTIAGSQLGETFVVARDGATVGAVSIDTRKAPSCR